MKFRNRVAIVFFKKKIKREEGNKWTLARLKKTKITAFSDKVLSEGKGDRNLMFSCLRWEASLDLKMRHCIKYARNS